MLQEVETRMRLYRVRVRKKVKLSNVARHEFDDKELMLDHINECLESPRATVTVPSFADSIANADPAGWGHEQTRDGIRSLWGPVDEQHTQQYYSTTLPSEDADTGTPISSLSPKHVRQLRSADSLKMGKKSIFGAPSHTSHGGDRLMDRSPKLSSGFRPSQMGFPEEATNRGSYTPKKTKEGQPDFDGNDKQCCAMCALM